MEKDEEKQVVTLETDAKDIVTKHIHDSFKLSDDDEKLFQKLLKMRASINGSFSLKFRIEMMKKILKESEIVKFSSPHDEFVDKTLPVFRFTIKSADNYLKDSILSDSAKKMVSSKSYKNNDDIPQNIINELTSFTSRILSREVFDKYIDQLIDAFEKHFQDDEELKKEYGELYDEIFQVIPEKQAKEFICSGIFHLRVYQNNPLSGQFEFVF